MSVLMVNAGSSSLKFSLHSVYLGVARPASMSGVIDGLEPQGRPTLTWETREGKFKKELLAGSSFDVALHSLQEVLSSLSGFQPLTAIAHRVVHGGQKYTGSVIVNPEVLDDLRAFSSLAPLHVPNNIRGIQTFMQAFPALPQVACFDTAFHLTSPELVHSFALPKELAAKGIRRYGFHGLSYQYVMGVLQDESSHANKRVLMAHLGNGASLCGALNGKSYTTSMGFSALDGLMMGTRCGTVDAGVLLHLMEQGWTYDELQNMLYKKSGLLGVSGISADMRKLRDSEAPEAKNAVAMFAHRIVREAGATVAAIGGLDVLSFSGGIGEHDPVLRENICKQLAWMGVEIDAEVNALATGSAVVKISTRQSAVEVWVIPTDEGIVGAREAVALLPRRVPSVVDCAHKEPRARMLA